MKKFFTILAIFGICATPMMKAQNFPDDPGTLMLDVALSAETTSGDTLQMTLTGAGSYASGTEVTIVAPERLGYTFVSWNDTIESSSYTFTLTESVSFMAKYNHDQYHIKFVDADGEVLQEGENFYGDELDVEDLKPVHDNTDQFTYVFLGWEPEVTPVTGSQTYYAKYDTITNEYEIRFLDWDEEVIFVDTVAYGVMPQFQGQTPTRATERGIVYTFEGWEPQLAEVTGEADYNAVYKADTIQYNVTIQIDETTRMQTAIWGEEIELNATEIVGKHFTEWSNGSADALIVVTIVSDTTFVATYEVNTYEIIFQHWDYSLLETDTVEYGVVPQYKGETPTRPTEDGVVYTFIGWEPTITAATENATYTAKFTDELLQFNVVTIIQNDTSTQTVNWGTEVPFTAEEKEGYTFIRWSNGLAENPMYITIVQDTTITAIYERNFYEIRFLDWNENVLEIDTVEHGVMPQFQGQDPTRETAMGIKYTFTGWNPTIVAATENADYTAVYSQEELEYTAYVICGKDTMNYVGTYGAQIDIQAVVPEDQHFVRWADNNTDNPRIIVLVSDTTLTAVFSDSYLNIPLNANTWAFICLPHFIDGGNYNSSLFTFVPAEGGNAPTLSWGTYNGAVRASAASGWETYANTSYDAGQGYIVSSPVAGTLKIEAYAENLMAEQTMTTALNQYSAVHEQNANWNFIGNPLNRELSANEISVDGISDASITIWNGTGYMNELIGQDGTATIQPLQAFFFQTTAQGNAMTFAQQGNPAPSRIMPSENSRIDIEATAGGYTDRTRVIFRANSSLRYEAGRDASKFLTSTAPVQLYFIDVDNVQCAQMVRPTGNDIMHLGFMMHQAGDLTINMPVFAGDYELYDALTGRSYDLNEQITIYSEKGTYNNRLELRPVERAYTGVDNTTVQNFVVTNRGIYVLGNAPVSVYSMVGQLVTTQQAQGIILLTNGSYIVVSGEQAEKVVLQ